LRHFSCRKGTGNGINAFIVWVATVAAYMPPGNTTVLVLVKRDPQFLIFDGGGRSRDPSTSSPGCQPFGNPINNIATIRKDRGLGATAHDLESLDGRL
jgi:hypothetical protein